jgi:SP family general alpha glucoside:H+ symporter-like MFS transporter
VNFCWGLGQLIGIGVIMSMLGREDEWAYRIPYSLQWMWPLPLAIGIFFAPESPWWLVRKGRLNEAKASLLRLTSLNRETDFDADETVDMMVHTTALEEKTTSGASYWDCFKGHDLRRTEVRQAVFREQADMMLTEIPADCVHGLGHPEPQWQLLFQLLDVLPHPGRP